MKEKPKALRCLLSILSVIIVLIIITGCNATLRKYEYVYNDKTYIGKIEIDGIVYTEIAEIMSQKLLEELEILRKEQDFEICIGRIDYDNGVDNWKYNIYGNRNPEERLLLIGEDSSIIGSNLPTVYFCEQEILRSFKSELESLDGIKIDKFLE